jgi:hypothetical protein
MAITCVCEHPEGEGKWVPRAPVCVSGTCGRAATSAAHLGTLLVSVYRVSSSRARVEGVELCASLTIFFFGGHTRGECAVSYPRWAVARAAWARGVAHSRRTRADDSRSRHVQRIHRSPALDEPPPRPSSLRQLTRGRAYNFQLFVTLLRAGYGSVPTSSSPRRGYLLAMITSPADTFVSSALQSPLCTNRKRPHRMPPAAYTGGCTACASSQRGPVAGR